MQVSIITPIKYHQIIIKTLQASKFYKLNAKTTDTDTITVTYDACSNDDYVFNHIRSLFWDLSRYRYPMHFVRSSYAESMAITDRTID
jgi:hypothetical protein